MTIGARAGIPDAEAGRWVVLWSARIGVAAPVRTERISPRHVAGEGGRRGCSLVGVVLDEAGACIYHTRRLTQEDIVHELLHVRHPAWSEAAVVARTASLLAAARRDAYSSRRANEYMVKNSTAQM